MELTIVRGRNQGRHGPVAPLPSQSCIAVPTGPFIGLAGRRRDAAGRITGLGVPRIWLRRSGFQGSSIPNLMFRCLTRGELRSRWRLVRRQGTSIPSTLEPPDLPLHVVEGAFEEGSPLLDRGHNHLQRGQPAVVVAVRLSQLVELDVAHTDLHLLDPLFDLAAPIVGDDRRVGLLTVEALHRADAVTERRPELLQLPDLGRGTLRLSRNCLLQEHDTTLHGGALLLVLRIAISDRLLPSSAALVDRIKPLQDFLERHLHVGLHHAVSSLAAREVGMRQLQSSAEER